MIARLTMCVCAGAVLAALPCRAISSSQVDHKIRRFAERNKAAEMVRAMEAVGIDTSDVSVEIRDRGNTVQLNGSVPCQKEFDRIPSVIEFYGPFRNVRNHIIYKARLILRNVDLPAVICCQAPVDFEDFARIGCKTRLVMPKDEDIKTKGTIMEIVTGVVRGTTISQVKLDEIVAKVKRTLP